MLITQRFIIDQVKGINIKAIIFFTTFSMLSNLVFGRWEALVVIHAILKKKIAFYLL